VEQPAKSTTADDHRRLALRAGRARVIPGCIFLLLFASCLVTPLLQTVHPVFPKIVAPVDEHRAVNQFPSPQLLRQATGDFAAGLNAWFDDRAGFRDLLIRTKNQIDYSVFGTSAKLYIGSQGWLFDRRARGRLDIELLSADEFKSIEERFVGLARRLAQRDIRLVVVGYPEKSMIYPEMMPPEEMPVAPPGGNADKLRHFLAAQPDIVFIDAQELLEREKSRTTEHLYYKMDVHASEIGQLPVVKEIIARIANAEGRSGIHWDEKFQLAHAVIPGGNQARFLAKLTPEDEDVPYFAGRHTIGAVETDGAWIIPDRRVLRRVDEGTGRPFDYAFYARPELCHERLPGAVLFGNSFSDLYWVLGLHRYFCFIRRERDPMSHFKLFYESMPAGTKYFIFQYYVPGLPRTAPPLDF
jgi:alginate O-acetyltransferase complex protein AlgJ